MAFMYVNIYHGPCYSFHTLQHRPQKLTGLRDHLLKLGFRVDLNTVDHVNYCMLEMCGHEIFRCNLRNLQFNTHYNRDPVCQRAVEAVILASDKFRSARSHLWFWTLIDHGIFRRGPHAPIDYWPHDVNISKPFVSCEDCVECCEMFIKPKGKEPPTASELSFTF